MTDIASKNSSAITIIYDNNPYNENLKTAWGFSCFIKIDEKAILFDTGGNGQLLLENMKKLGIDPSQVDIVVLSHIHGDHTGGLEAFLNQNSNVTVYLPQSFPSSFKNMVQNKGAKVVEIGKDESICNDVMTTGELGTAIKEQALIVDSPEGAIIITGCAHPGIVTILKKTGQLGKKEIALVLGGFHLGGESDKAISEIISDFRRLNVKKVGPCHCTGDRARQLFSKEYGKNYINVGVGKIINF